MATVDLWPDEIATDGGLEGPSVVLKEQAALLGQKTKGLVEAEVKSVVSSHSSDHFLDAFYLFSPTINYQMTLFRVLYPLEFYPATIIWDDYGAEAEYYSYDTPAKAINSREELEQELKIIFSHTKTIRIIHALISRSRI